MATVLPFYVVKPPLMYRKVVTVLPFYVVKPPLMYQKMTSFDVSEMDTVLQFYVV